MSVVPAGRRYQRKFDWDEARRLHDEGHSYSAIAAMLGVSYSGVRRVLDEEWGVRLNANARRWSQRECEECGAPCWHRAQRRGGQLCVKCAAKKYNRTRFRYSASGAVTEVRCVTCRRWKLPSGFTVGDGAEGLHTQCKSCQSKEKARWRARNMLPCEVCGEKKVCPDGRRQTGYDVCRDCYNRLRSLYRVNTVADCMRAWRSE